MDERTTRPESRRGWLSCLAALVTLAPAAAPAQPAMSPAAAARPSSPAEPGAKPVSLQEAIQIAQQNQGSVATAEESVESARQQVRIARVGTLPSITGSVGYQGTGTSSLGGLFGPGPTQTIPGTNGQPSRQVSVNTDTTTFNHGLQPRIAFTYTPFDSGLTRAQVRQARAGVETSLANLASVRNDLSLTVTTDYLAQLRAQRLLDLRRVQEELALTQLRQVEARIREGAAAEADRALPLSQYRNTQVDRIQAQNDVRVTAVILRDSMGLPAGPPLQLVELPAEEAPLPPQETLISIAQRERPEVTQAEAQVRVAEAGVSIARVGRKPRLDTTLAFNLTPNNELSRSDYAIGAAISLPIWDAGLTQAQELQAKTRVQSAAAQLEQIRKDVASDVGQAYFNLISARERTEAGRLAVEAAQVNLAQTTARYQRGVAGTTIVELIQAQVQFATANNNLINAIYDAHIARAQLSRAIGKQPAQ